MNESQETQARNNVGCVIRLVGRCDVNGANFTHAPPNKATQVDYQFQPRGPPLTYSSYREHAAKQNTLFFIGTFTLWGRFSFGCSRQVQDEHGKSALIAFLSFLHLVITGSVLSTGKRSLTACWHRKWSMKPGWLSTAPVSSPKTDVASTYSLWCCSQLVAAAEKESVPKKWGIWSGSVLVYACVDPVSAGPSFDCVVLPLTQVEAGWLHGELLGDSTHSEHVPQPRQSPSLLGLLRQAHWSVEQELSLSSELHVLISHVFIYLFSSHECKIL